MVGKDCCNRENIDFRRPVLPINQSISVMSISSHHILAILDSSEASQPSSQDFNQSTPTRQSGMVQPVIQEMFVS
eukprot:scaffold50_cov107-Isochrysis_galbana.AAC.1